MKDAHIGIRMGGYTDENERVMDRTELNKRISRLQERLDRAIRLLSKSSVCDTPLYTNGELDSCQGCPDCRPVNAGKDGSME